MRVDGVFHDVLKDGQSIGLVVGAASAGGAVESLLEVMFRVVKGTMWGVNHLLKEVIEINP